MAARKSPDGRFVRALDLWGAPAGAGEPLVCLATTFTFDAAFFETECLGRFLQMDSHPTESEPAAYLVEREEKLASTRTAVFVDRRHAGDKESLRWDVLPVRIPSGVQHAKISVLVWANAARLIVGSGNLTKHGYRENLEVFGSIDISRGEPSRVDLLLQGTEFAGQMLEMVPGDLGAQGPKRRAAEAVERVRQHVRRWPRGDPASNLSLVLGSQAKSVVGQLSELWPSNSPIRAVYICAPFYERPPGDKALAERLASLVAKRGDREFLVDVPVEVLPSNETVVRVSRTFVTRLLDSGADVKVRRIQPEQRGVDEAEPEVRPFHAKLSWIENDYWTTLMIGSSNCTSAGLGVGKSRNLEANLVYSFHTDTPQVRLLAETWPMVFEEPIDINDSRLRWEPTFEEEQDSQGDVLPLGFEEAIFKASEPRELHLRLGTKLPAEWAVHSSDDLLLLDARATRAKGAGVVVVPWEQPGVPVVLKATWTQDERRAAALWPVNVLDPGDLPPPEVLRDLTLEELVEVLSTTRPMHEAIARLLAKRTRRTGRVDVELDPLKRINTEEFLLRRTRRVALALDRLRERLERPVLSAEALAWRLRGPIGPTALAKAFVVEAKLPGEAPFLLAELVLMLRRVQPSLPARGGLPEREIQRELTRLVDEIASQGATLLDGSTPAAMAQYVREAVQGSLT